MTRWTSPPSGLSGRSERMAKSDQEGAPMNMPMKSHYSDAPKATPPARHTLSVLVDNEPGVLARIAGLFSGRGYNIESLTVSETEHEKHISRITIVTTGTNAVVEQIKSQLARLVPVHR